jgi:hypothetical protein
MIIGQQVQTQLIYIQPLRIELSASIPSSSFCFFKVLPLEKRVLAWAVRCIGLVRRDAGRKHLLNLAYN